MNKNLINNCSNHLKNDIDNCLLYLYLCKINNYEPNILIKIFKVLTDYVILLTNRNTNSNIYVDIKEIALKPQQKDIIIKKICQVNYIENYFYGSHIGKYDKYFEIPMISHFEVKAYKLFPVYFGNLEVELGNMGLNKGIKHLVIPEGVTIINRRLFSYCKGIEKITFPKSLVEIRSQAFSDCLSIKQLNFPDSLKIIDARAFYNCYSIESVKLSRSLITISNEAFKLCTNLSNIEFNEKLKYINIQAFYGCKFKNVVIPKSIKSIHCSAFDFNSYLSEFLIPEKIGKKIKKQIESGKFFKNSVGLNAHNFLEVIQYK